MICLKCSTLNESGSRWCAKCNGLLLPQIPGVSFGSDEEESSPLSLEHRSPTLLDLAWAIHDFDQGESTLEAVMDLYEAYRDSFDDVRDGTGNFFEEIETEEIGVQAREDLDLAVNLYGSGESLFEDYFEQVEDLSEAEEYPETTPLFEAIRHWLQCNQRLTRALLNLPGAKSALASVESEL